ncbi:MAG: ABC transporter permease subunit [Planctomycetota bacterium]|nr:MAG: ABC transporter permease subunit [Planctomycetota bacterium]
MSGMLSYFTRRLLLVPLTFVVITFLVYAILRVVPGGPIEQAEAALKAAAMSGESGGGLDLGSEADLELDEDAFRELQRFYALDQPVAVGYLQWLGVLPREVRRRVPRSTLERDKAVFEPLQQLASAAVRVRTEIEQALAEHGWLLWRGEVYEPLEGIDALPADLRERVRELEARGIGARDELIALLTSRGFGYTRVRLLRRIDPDAEPAASERAAVLEKIAPALDALRLAQAKRDEVAREHGYEIDDEGRIYRVERRFAGILEGEFGTSYTHNEPVLRLITSKFKVSIIFGLTGYLLTWLVCVPLGIVKAIRHRSWFDTLSSFVVFLGYAMPGFVVALLLLSTLAVRVDWIPLGGFQSEHFADMTLPQQIWDRFRHMLIPVIGYMVGSFATMTILMKNSLMENLGADYVRTAFAKGLSERRVIYVHALRNSLIPITAGIGNAIGLLFAGSFLIEYTCNIPGMGLLGYEAVIQRDYPIILGILVFGVLIRLFGNILSDLIWAWIDPRIRFQ